MLDRLPQSFLAGLIPLAALACSAPVPSKAAEAQPGVTLPAAPASHAIVATAAPRCTLQKPVEIVDDEDGETDEYGFVAAENARILATKDEVLITWERQSHYAVGDSTRAPVAAHRQGGSPWKIVTLPVLSYACATYGYIAPRQTVRGLGIVAWGEDNYTGFEAWTGLSNGKTVKVAGSPMYRLGKAERILPTTLEMLAGSFVLSDHTILASTREGCDRVCDCQSTWQGVRLFDLDASPRRTERIFKGEGVDALALVTSSRGGALAFRHQRALHFGWLDASLRSVGPPQKFAEGDVGAPALALLGDKLLAVWAARNDKSAPYVLQWSLLEAGKSPGAPRTFRTVDSAFAPAILAEDTSLVLTWMEGDGQKRGRILAKRLDTKDFGESLEDAIAISGDEPNARDPEISGTVAAPHIVYSTFSKKIGGGKIRHAELTCE